MRLDDLQVDLAGGNAHRLVTGGVSDGSGVLESNT
jgi:hypothetical protein